MRLLWLCNLAPSAVEEKRGGKAGGGLWMDQMLEGLRNLGAEIRILCPGSTCMDGVVDSRCSFHCFRTAEPHEYQKGLEFEFRQQLKTFRPQVVHVWGTEFGHTLAMMRACREEDLLDHTVVSIQGLCYIYAGHYAEGLPCRIRRQYTFRDFLRRDNVVQQARKFSIRGLHELEALGLARHAIGRTDWDRACVSQIRPDCTYHFCNETLRQDFYEGSWSYATCRTHRIFASSSAYPVKGLHYLIQALAQVKRVYPDATLAVPGRDLLAEDTLRGRLRQTAYQRFLIRLIRQYGLEDSVEFLGRLSAEQMKQNYLQANVFALPSTIENSPNSLGEAMLLGVPCVAAHVGGVTTMMEDRKEGFVYQSTAPYMLAHYIMEVFAMGQKAETMGAAAAAHARRTHDPDTNLRTLVKIYEEIGREEA